MQHPNIGGSHCYGYAHQEVFGATIPRPVNRFAEVENADIVIANQHTTAVGEVGIVCSFARAWGWFPHVYGKLLAAATGDERFSDLGYLFKVGERIVNLERAFNAREGAGRKDDRLPDRLMKEVLPPVSAKADGRSPTVPERPEAVKEQINSREYLDRMLDEYYEARGWDKSTGRPTRARLEKLGLKDVADALDRLPKTT
jgi:aldehyde:ferredoxin oxidoreductase